MIKIRKAMTEDIHQIVNIHKLSYPKYHFTNTFSNNLLYKYYQEIIAFNEYCFIAENSQKDVIGFLIAGTKAGEGANKFVSGYKIRLILLLMRHPEFLLEKIFLYVKNNLFKKANISTNIEVTVTSMAVKKNEKHRNVGTHLLYELEFVLKSDNIRQYGLFVRKNNSIAIDFYKKNGFSYQHQADKSIYFRKNL